MQLTLLFHTMSPKVHYFLLYTNSPPTATQLGRNNHDHEACASEQRIDCSRPHLDTPYHVSCGRNARSAQHDLGSSLCDGASGDHDGLLLLQTVGRILSRGCEGPLHGVVADPTCISPCRCGVGGCDIKILDCNCCLHAVRRDFYGSLEFY